MTRTATEVRDQLRRVGFPSVSVEEPTERRITLWEGQRRVACEAGALIEALQRLPDDLGAMDDYHGQMPAEVFWRAVGQAEVR